MKAYLLAAGLGKRLYPLTRDVPKCMAPIAGKPLLRIWLELLTSHGIEDVLINTHYLAEKVHEFARAWTTPPRLHITTEEALLGSAGTLRQNRDFVRGEEDFLVCNGDTLTDMDLGQLIQFHRMRRALVTMALFRTERPSECGIVEIDDEGQVLSFEEKPAAPRACVANGGIYVMRADVIERLPVKPVCDIGFDLLPQCLGEMYGFLWKGVLIDIGTPKSYVLAQDAWTRRMIAA
ncbi:MAG: nucleotidyltransferase family protein [Acidobacteriales bacterium]|nr:nucleotidyltransferase family protein [Terriglobales bacterium]